VSYPVESENTAIRFDSREFTGALGDSITVLPIVIALALVTPLSLAHTLVGFGVFQIVWGLWYGIPISVEPMKALAGLAIAGAISYGDLVAAGLLAGGTLLVIGRFGLLGHVERLIGEPVVRGVQLAVALLLGYSGLELAAGEPLLAAGSVAIVGGAVAVGVGSGSILLVLALGLLLALWTVGIPTVSLPTATLFAGGGPTFTATALEATLGQLAMTVGNAAVATALLCSDFFDRDISPDELAESMGAMSLIAVPLGGLPMCHGSGGLAGKYAFGARTGGANLLLGGLYLAAALVAGLVVAFPIAMLGVLLLIVAYQLARTAIQTEWLGLTVAVGLAGAVFNVGAAFALGVIGWLLYRRFDRR